MFGRRWQALPDAMKQALLYAVSLAAVKGVGLLLIPVMTHSLTVADYGRLDILQTLADLLSIVIGMGLADTLFRFAGAAETHQQKQQVAADLLGMALIIGLLTLLITQLAAPTIQHWLPGDVSLLQVRLLLGCLAIGGVSTLSLSYLRLNEDAAGYAWLSIARVVAQAALAVAFLTAGFGVTGVMWASLLAATAVGIWLFSLQLRQTGIRFNFTATLGYLRYGSPLILVGMAGFVLGSFDRWLLAGAVGPAAMALYALAAKLGLVTALMIQPFELWWLPRRFATLQGANGPQRCVRMTTIGVLIGLSAALLVSMAGPVLVRWLTPPPYHAATDYVPFMAVIAVLHSMNGLFVMGCYQRHTRLPAMIDSVAALMALCGYLLLIPEHGAWGAIFATLLALTTRLVATIWISQRCLPLPFAYRRLVALVLISLLFGLSLCQLNDVLLRTLAGVAAVSGVWLLAILLRLVALPFTRLNSPQQAHP
ncbi:lipopolysaccharide biosynthesis protein [Bowmanella sp. JS7-9]|uniref:lipopolysaccharide biosynthesis protein n=1 Tax=Alteromonadaceae TaxID=72275 RepID=UPI00103C7838|nr:oligosaccharide flippase family protein [Bowmanella sp. JS7-9]TBX24691.1 hypothetical protein TK45_04520 [Bowmanella sp. JS7-9]